MLALLAALEKGGEMGQCMDMQRRGPTMSSGEKD